MFSVDAQKSNFFDRPKVLSAVDRGTRQALSKFGSFVRRGAKSSLRYKNKINPAGGPPAVHKTQGFTRTRKRKGVESKQPASPLRELIYFAYDAPSKSVIIGPAIFNNSKVGGGKAPRVLEMGGTSPVLRRSGNGKQKLVMGKYPARPYMRPAFDTNLPKLAGWLRFK